METTEKSIKIGLLFAFSFLNAVDMVQTVYFLNMGIEGNQFVVHYPYLWFPLKFLLAFGLPVGLNRLDLYLEEKEDEESFTHLKLLVSLMYLTIFLADVYFLSLVLKNTRILGRLLP